MRHGLTKEQIKAIADRAEGKEPEPELRTFVCKQCNHEVVVKPGLAKWESPVYCTPCLEERRAGVTPKPAPIDMNTILDLAKETNKLFETLQKIEKQP